PHPRDYGYSIPKEKTRGAVRAARSAKVRDAGFLVLEDLPAADGKTKSLAVMLKVLGLAGKTLIVAGGEQDRLRRAATNLARVTGVQPEGVHGRDALTSASGLI